MILYLAVRSGRIKELTMSRESLGLEPATPRTEEPEKLVEFDSE